MRTPHNLPTQLLNAAFISAQNVELVPRGRGWRWLRNAIEAVLTTTRLFDPFPLGSLYQQVSGFVHLHEVAFGIGFAILTLIISIGEQRAFSTLLAKILA